ncbi:hypothetical protein M758_7G175200 [Ceratodon purpureus]|nr:hypothetical protein M758_7G175200 [Ceratodon purpureus]
MPIAHCSLLIAHCSLLIALSRVTSHNLTLPTNAITVPHPSCSLHSTPLHSGSPFLHIPKQPPLSSSGFPFPATATVPRHAIAPACGRPTDRPTDRHIG